MLDFRKSLCQGGSACLCVGRRLLSLIPLVVTLQGDYVSSQSVRTGRGSGGEMWESPIGVCVSEHACVRKSNLCVVSVVGCQISEGGGEIGQHLSPWQKPIIQSPPSPRLFMFLWSYGGKSWKQSGLRWNQTRKQVRWLHLSTGPTDSAPMASQIGRTCWLQEGQIPELSWTLLVRLTGSDTFLNIFSIIPIF